MGLSSVFADGVERTYTNITAGSLSTRISNDNVDPLTITDLTITGNLNGTDFRLIREMAGNNYLGEPKSGSLKKLDLSGANIVAGGEKYLDTDRITSSTGTYTQNNGYNSFHYETENNVLGKSLFAGCDKLEEVILPNSLTAIGEYQFWYCLNLKSISIGKNVSSIGWQLVFGPNKLTSISIAEGNATFSSPANTNLLMQGTKVFLGYGNPTFPAGTTVIGSDAFSNCAGLGDVTLPEGVTTIEGGAFAWSSLKSITFPSTLTTIGNDAFAGCYNLTSFTLPKTVTHYGEGLGALKDCGNLTSISVEKDNPVYDSRDNCNAIIETNTNTLISGCKNTVIPTSVTILGHQAFRGVTLSNYVIPNWITTIGEMAFWNANMTSVTIPSSVTYIGEYAFAYPISLTTVTVESVTPVTISENTFTDRSNTDLIVPEGYSDAYKGANYWKDFKSIKDTKGNSEDPITEATINVATAGTLATKISNDEKFTITDLTITGQLNGTDFRLLREMAGCDYMGRPTNGQLQKLDLSGATIVAGGDKYFDRDGLYDEEGNQQYGFDLHSVTTRDNVIGECLFAGCSRLEEIKIPTNIIEIGEFAFMCTNISSFDIPETVEKVALPFFYGTKVSTLHIPKNVAILTASYFMGNQATLSSITVDANNAKFDSRNNCNAIIEKESNTLLLGCKNTTIPDGVTFIGEYAFSYSYGYTSITLPTSVTSLKEGAFFASGLASISLPSALKRIEFNALAYTNIASITIPASVEFIGQSALRACTDLAQITVEAENTKYDSRDNCNAIIEKATNTLIQGCKTSTIPATVTAIGSQAFQECQGLTSISIPSSVSSIADNAFFQCNNLISVLVEIKTPLAISEKTFSNRAEATLYVPEGSKADYEGAAYWKEFSSIEEVAEMVDPSVRTVNVTAAGTLSQSISSDDMSSITELTITGQLNGTDLRLIREMAGNDYLGQPTDGSLKKLDLSGANIVEGGEKYLDTDRVTSSTGTYTQNVGVNSFHYATHNNVLGTSVFAGCDKLEEVILPNSITSIGDYVFWYCLNLKALEIPKNVSSIGWEFIYGPNKISKLSVAEGNQYFSSPEGSNVLMQGTRLIFGLSGAQIPAGTTIIGTEAFRDCSGLGDVIIPEGVTTIEVGAFAWSGLTSIKMPSTLTTIGNDAFAGCSGLTSFTLPKTVVSYGDGSEGGLGALKDCVNLTSIKVEDGNPKYDSRNSCNGIIETATNTLISGCKNTVIPNTVTIIGHQAFRGINLSDFEIPNWITTLGERAFWSSSLTSIKIPSSVTKIGELAFEYCNNLTSVSVEVKTPLVITENTFSNRANATLYVPAGCKAAYEAADYWKEFSSIKEMAQPSVVTVTAKSYSRAYGEANPTFESEVTGGTVTGTPEITCTATATSGVGTYPIVIAAGTITDASVQYVNGTLTVTKAPLKISAGNYTKKQGEENPPFTLTYDGFKNNETAAVFTTQPTITCAATKDSPVGTYDITVSGAVAGNYEISYVAGTLTVEAVTPPTPMPEPKGTTFDLDTDDSSSKEVKITFVVKESDGSSTPTVAISDDKDASGSVSIPESVTHNGVEYKVTEISEGAFQNNTSLTEVKIPASITSIGPKAFAGCKNLQEITINIIVPINLSIISARGYTRAESGDVFEGVNKETCILYVPEGSVDAYKAAPVWKDFKNILPIKTSTRIYGIESDGDGEPFDVYSLSGQKVKSKTTSLDGLPRGIYIIKGKKVIK